MTVNMKKNEARQGEKRSSQQRVLVISVIAAAVALLGAFLIFYLF